MTPNHTQTQTPAQTLAQKKIQTPADTGTDTCTGTGTRSHTALLLNFISFYDTHACSPTFIPFELCLQVATFEWSLAWEDLEPLLNPKASQAHRL